jgi:YHS domain-containing protein
LGKIERVAEALIERGTLQTDEIEALLGPPLASGLQTSARVFPRIDGKTYCFGNEEAKTMFMKDPKGNMAKAQEYYSSTHKKM